MPTAIEPDTLIAIEYVGPWPHKFYLETPNPKAAELVEVGSACGPEITWQTPGAVFDRTIAQHGVLAVASSRVDRDEIDSLIDSGLFRGGLLVLADDDHAAEQCKNHGVTHAIGGSVALLAKLHTVRWRYAVAPTEEDQEGLIAAVRPVPDLAAAVNEIYRTFGYWKTVTMGTRPTLHLKFYNVHLEQATAEQLAEFCALSEAAFGIEWHRGAEGQIGYIAKTLGEQRWGVVGADGKPDHSDMKTPGPRP